MSSNDTVTPGNGQSARIVAELGRPETLEETVARKAENSRKYRASKTINNLWLSLLACLAVVIVIVLLVPRDDTSHLQSVDYRSIANSAQPVLPVPLAMPDLSTAWSANAAEIRSGEQIQVRSWYIGFVTPSQTFIGLTQAINANPSWLAQELHNTLASDTVTINGVQWTVYDNRNSPDDVGNVDYALTTEAGKSTYVLFGNASDTEFEELARGLVSNIAAQTTSNGAVAS